MYGQPYLSTIGMTYHTNPRQHHLLDPHHDDRIQTNKNMPACIGLFVESTIADSIVARTLGATKRLISVRNDNKLSESGMTLKLPLGMVYPRLECTVMHKGNSLRSRLSVSTSRWLRFSQNKAIGRILRTAGLQQHQEHPQPRLSNYNG